MRDVKTARVSVIVNKKGKKWTKTVYWFSTFTRGKDVDKFSSFEEAYRSAREYNKDKIQIVWHPPWMQKAMKKVEAEISAGQYKDDEAKERELLKLLKKKYEKKKK